MRDGLLKRQRHLAALVLGQVPDDADGWTRAVAESTGMRVTRSIVASWRDLLIRQICPLSVSLLVRKGRLESELSALSSRPASAWIDELALVFLSRLAADPDPLVAAIAAFECAALAVRQGVVERVTVIWPCDPEELIRRLADGSPLDGIPIGEFEIVVASAGITN